MDFFQQLEALQLQGDLKMVITSTPAGMIVSLLLNNEACKDEARKVIPPLLLRGTAQEIDEAFFDTISQPLQVTSGLQVDMDAYMKGVDAAKKQSSMAKSTTPSTPAKPTIDPLTVAYDTAMKKVEELITSKKYKDAIAKLPDVKTHPAKKAIIDARKNWLVQMALDGGGMFPQPYPQDTTDVTPIADTTAESVLAEPEADASEEEELEEQEQEND